MIVDMTVLFDTAVDARSRTGRAPASTPVTGIKCELEYRYQGTLYRVNLYLKRFISRLGIMPPTGYPASDAGLDTARHPRPDD